MIKKPIYRQIYEEIRDNIQSGKYKTGDKIPTESEWATLYGVSRITSQKALDLAADDDLISKKPGKGSFVKENAKRKSCYRRTNGKLIGIIQPDYSDLYGLEIFNTVMNLTQESGDLLLTGLSNNDIETEKKTIQQFISSGVDGLIIFPVHDESFNIEIMKLIFDGFPVVLVDRYLKDISCPNVISRNLDAACKGMKYLYSFGHKHIGIISRAIGTTSSLQEREKGIMNAAMESGYTINPDKWYTSFYDLDPINDADKYNGQIKDVKNFLLRNKEITAVFGLEYTALGPVFSAAHELGLKIPEDLSIICFDSPSNLLHDICSISHMKQNETEIATRAFLLLQKMFAGETFDLKQYIDVDLIPGKSVVSPGQN